MAKTTLKVDPTKPEIVTERVFDAPREKVWKVMTDPSLISQWWGPRNLKTEVDTMDFSVGGVWRYIHTDAKGDTYAFNGKYLEIEPIEKIIDTFEFEPMAGHISTETLILTELPGNKTKVTVTSVFANMEDRDGMVNSGMESGLNESHDRLAELLAKS